jgi:hypothetical protein
LLTTALQARKLSDFSGTWRVDPTKVVAKVSVARNPPADAPAIPPPPPENHEYTLEEIQVSGQILKISGGEAGTTAVYTIDPSGKEVSDPIPDAPGSVRVASTRWSHGKLITRWKLTRNGEVFMQGTDTRSLTSDGRQIVERIIKSPRHQAEVKLVLARVH